MAKVKLPKPTAAELAILRVLWDNGPSTVREVHDVLSKKREIGYTTVLKIMQIMTDKGIVLRDESNRSHIYEPKLAAEQTQKQLVKDLLDKAFGGSLPKLVMNALAAKRTSSKDLAEIKKILREAEKKKK